MQAGEGRACFWFIIAHLEILSCEPDVVEIGMLCPGYDERLSNFLKTVNPHLRLWKSDNLVCPCGIDVQIDPRKVQLSCRVVLQSLLIESSPTPGPTR